MIKNWMFFGKSFHLFINIDYFSHDISLLFFE